MNTLQSNPVSQPDIDDVNIKSIQTLITPAELKADLPLSDAASQTVLQGRATVRNILDGNDKRLFVVIGPCSIHDPKAAHEYADRLKVKATATISLSATGSRKAPKGVLCSSRRAR